MLLERLASRIGEAKIKPDTDIIAKIRGNRNDRA